VNYLLDTNVCIELLRGRNPIIATKLATLNPQTVTICSVVKAELFFGANRSTNPKNALTTVKAFIENFHSFPFDDQAAEIYGELRAFLTKTGNIIGPNDLQIAAIALAHKLIVVTHNTKEFARVPNLNIEDWQI